MDRYFHRPGDRRYDETSEILISMVSGALGDWERADDQRPRVARSAIEETIEDYLSSTEGQDLIRLPPSAFGQSPDPLDRAAEAILDRMQRGGAKFYL